MNRSRKNSLQERSEHEILFVQRGNFLNKQYLKVNMFRDRMDDIEKKRSSIPKNTFRTMSESKRAADMM